jgi:hypothetical protein
VKLCGNLNSWLIRFFCIRIKDEDKQLRCLSYAVAARFSNLPDTISGEVLPCNVQSVILTILIRQNTVADAVTN